MLCTKEEVTIDIGVGSVSDAIILPPLSIPPRKVEFVEDDFAMQAVAGWSTPSRTTQAKQEHCFRPKREGAKFVVGSGTLIVDSTVLPESASSEILEQKPERICGRVTASNNSGTTTTVITGHLAGTQVYQP